MLRRQRPDSLLSVCAFTGVTAATWLAEEDKTPPTGGVGGNRKVGVPLFADGKGKSQVSLPRVTGKRRGLGPQTHALCPGAESADPAGGAPGERRACPQPLTHSNSLQPLPWQTGGSHPAPQPAGWASRTKAPPVELSVVLSTTGTETFWLALN